MLFTRRGGVAARGSVLDGRAGLGGRLGVGEGVRLAGHGREGGGDLVEGGLDVGGGGCSGGVGVAGVGAGDAVAEVTFDPGQGGVGAASAWTRSRCGQRAGRRRRELAPGEPRRILVITSM
jgi:hypothetical protein